MKTIRSIAWLFRGEDRPPLWLALLFLAVAVINGVALLMWGLRLVEALKLL